MLFRVEVDFGPATFWGPRAVAFIVRAESADEARTKVVSRYQKWCTVEVSPVELDEDGVCLVYSDEAR